MNLIIQTSYQPTFMALVEQGSIKKLAWLDQITFHKLDFKLPESKSLNIFQNLGPGSYTGTRQALAFSQAIALTRPKVKLISFTSFDLAKNVLENENLLKTNSQKASIDLLLKAWPRNKIDKNTPLSKIRLFQLSYKLEHPKIQTEFQLIPLLQLKLNPSSRSKVYTNLPATYLANHKSQLPHLNKLKTTNFSFTKNNILKSLPNLVQNLTDRHHDPNPTPLYTSQF